MTIKELVIARRPFELTLDELLELGRIKLAQSTETLPASKPEVPEPGVQPETQKPAPKEEPVVPPGTTPPVTPATSETIEIKNPMIFGGGLGIEDIRPLVNQWKTMSAEQLKEERNKYLQELVKAEGSQPIASLGKLLLLQTAHSLKQQNIDPERFESMLAAVTTGADFKFSRSEIINAFEKNKNALEQLLGKEKIQLQGGLFNSFLNIWDDLEPSQKVALAIGVPLGLVALGSMFFEGPTFANILGLGAAIAGGVYALSPNVRSLASAALGVGQAGKVKAKIAIASVLAKLVKLPDNVHPMWGSVVREPIPITVDVNIPEGVQMIASNFVSNLFTESPAQAAATLRGLLDNQMLVNQLTPALARYGISLDDLKSLTDQEIIGILASVYQQLKNKK